MSHGDVMLPGPSFVVAHFLLTAPNGCEVIQIFILFSFNYSLVPIEKNQRKSQIAVQMPRFVCVFYAVYATIDVQDETIVRYEYETAQSHAKKMYRESPLSPSSHTHATENATRDRRRVYISDFRCFQMVVLSSIDNNR